ncbi:PREDICTED: cuticle collagen 7-like, partial [Cercocebus atys]|uniref:cuticle collagen 7-like n=1 Tax=Cercocebus atys TaxID=9531 RepID=UPI0005F49088
GAPAARLLGAGPPEPGQSCASRGAPASSASPARGSPAGPSGRLAGRREPSDLDPAGTAARAARSRGPAPCRREPAGNSGVCSRPNPQTDCPSGPPVPPGSGEEGRTAAPRQALPAGLGAEGRAFGERQGGSRVWRERRGQNVSQSANALYFQTPPRAGGCSVHGDIAKGEGETRPRDPFLVRFQVASTGMKGQRGSPSQAPPTGSPGSRGTTSSHRNPRVEQTTRSQGAARVGGGPRSISGAA